MAKSVWQMLLKPIGITRIEFERELRRCGIPVRTLSEEDVREDCPGGSSGNYHVVNMDAIIDNTLISNFAVVHGEDLLQRIVERILFIPQEHANTLLKRMIEHGYYSLFQTLNSLLSE